MCFASGNFKLEKIRHRFTKGNVFVYRFIGMRAEESSAYLDMFCSQIGTSDITSLLIIIVTFGLTFASHDDMHGNTFACTKANPI